MKTTTDQQQGLLLKKFHTKCAKAGLTADEKSSLISAYGHNSSRDMSIAELAKACDLIDARMNPQLGEMDKWRKRLMAAVGGWLQLMSVESNIAKIKGIACRASERDQFNDIPREQLISLYYAFLKKQKDFKRVDGIVKEQLEDLKYMN